MSKIGWSPASSTYTYSATYNRPCDWKYEDGGHLGSPAYQAYRTDDYRSPDPDSFEGNFPGAEISRRPTYAYIDNRAFYYPQTSYSPEVYAPPRRTSGWDLLAAGILGLTAGAVGSAFLWPMSLYGRGCWSYPLFTPWYSGCGYRFPLFGWC